MTEKGTDVSLPIDYSLEISDKDYIIFLEKKDTLLTEIYDKQVTVKEEKKTRYDINLKMEVTRTAQVTIYLPSDMGSIKAEGNGNLALKANSNGDFTLIGDYNVRDGMFKFSLANLVNKKFIR